MNNPDTQHYDIIDVLKKAVFNKKRLIELGPKWFKNPNDINKYGLLYFENDFFGPIGKLRFVSFGKMRRVIAYENLRRIYLNLFFFSKSIIGAFGLLELFKLLRISSSVKLSVSFLFIVLIFIQIPGLILLRTIKFNVNELPKADLSQEVLDSRNSINFVLGFFYFFLNILLSIIILLDSPNQLPDEEVAKEIKETIEDEAPEVMKSITYSHKNSLYSFFIGCFGSIIRILIGILLPLGFVLFMISKKFAEVGFVLYLFIIVGIIFLQIKSYKTFKKETR